MLPTERLHVTASFVLVLLALLQPMAFFDIAMGYLPDMPQTTMSLDQT